MYHWYNKIIEEANAQLQIPIIYILYVSLDIEGFESLLYMVRGIIFMEGYMTFLIDSIKCLAFWIQNVSCLLYHTYVDKQWYHVNKCHG